MQKYKTKEEVWNWLKENVQLFDTDTFTIHDDLTIDCRDDVSIAGHNLSHIPVQFGKIEGYFSCANNRLKSLEGCPRYVRDYFNCSHNQLDSLKYFPMEVGGSVSCYSNLLKDLTGLPESIEGYLECHNNRLTSLKGSPLKILTHFKCSDNYLTNLVGGPTEVGAFYMCQGNMITSLEGSPEHIKESFNCGWNLLTDFIHSPVLIEGDFNCQGNPVNDLKFLATENTLQKKINIMGHFYHRVDTKYLGKPGKTQPISLFKDRYEHSEGTEYFLKLSQQEITLAYLKLELEGKLQDKNSTGKKRKI